MRAGDGESKRKRKRKLNLDLVVDVDVDVQQVQPTRVEYAQRDTLQGSPRRRDGEWATRPV